MSWDSLGDAYRFNAEQAERERTTPPVDCPAHGWPLEAGRKEGTLHCVWGGDVYDSAGKLILNPR